MKLEKFNYSNGKRGRWFLYGVICTAVLMVLLNLFLSEAKYYNTESIPIAKGTIKNYSPTDFKLLAIKLENASGEYENTNKIPDTGYVLNEEKSYCSIPNDDGEEIKDSSVIINYHDGVVGFDNIDTKNTKCYLYFDIFKYTQIVNYTMLYYYGDEYTDVTGGWTANYNINTNNTSTFCDSYFFTNNNIDTSLYTGVAIRYIYNSGDAGANKGRFGVGGIGPRNIPGQAAAHGNEVLLISDFDKKIGQIYIDIGNCNSTKHLESKGSDYLYMYMYQSSTWVYELKVYAVAFYKEDDWSEIVKKAEITTPSSLSSLLSDNTALTTILSSYDAVQYMLYNCTGDFMASAITSSTFLSALNNSPYKDLVYENEHWSKFLSMVS